MDSLQSASFFGPLGSGALVSWQNESPRDPSTLLVLVNLLHLAPLCTAAATGSPSAHLGKRLPRVHITRLPRVSRHDTFPIDTHVEDTQTTRSRSRQTCAAVVHSSVGSSEGHGSSSVSAPHATRLDGDDDRGWRRLASDGIGEICGTDRVL
ncbi:hypothetical protein DFH06DRAFT_716008 [Mycena polygramma]|nr:hypothetical protein DFH06DRAFT_374382 [Mycena polygramma]KAJ7983119.1 hypothetical protein DFH06DRAFT_716008 [Mycena polygramma]